MAVRAALWFLAKVYPIVITICRASLFLRAILHLQYGVDLPVPNATLLIRFPSPPHSKSSPGYAQRAAVLIQLRNDSTIT
jgi:hypothetical protein